MSFCLIVNFCLFTEPVLRNKHINCFDAAFTLMYSIFVREKGAMVFSFTDSKDKLAKLIMPTNDYKMAKEAVELRMVIHSNAFG